MRVLHVLDHSIPEHSGYSFRTLSLLRGQRALGWETMHLTGPKHDGDGRTEEVVDGWHFYRTPSAQGLLSGIPVLTELELMGDLAHRLHELALKLRPHIIHAHSPVLDAIPALRVGRRLRIPVVYEIRAFWEDAAVEHGTTRYDSLRYRASRALETHAVRRADAVVTICEGLRGELIARGVPASKIAVVPNAVDAEQFSTAVERDAELSRSLGLEGCTVLGFLGSFYSYEGLDLLLQAMPSILRQRADVRLLLAGGGPEDARLRALTAELGLEKTVRFVGRVPHAEVKRYYDLVDILVYPRHGGRLTDLVTPLKPLEAMAQAKLVVASDVGGHRELMRDGETASLFRAGDPDDLCRSVLELLDAPQRWPAMRAAGRRYVESERTWAHSVANYEPVYARLAGPARRAA